MRFAPIVFSLFILLLPSWAYAQQSAPPNGFLTTGEILGLLEFENFDDFHTLEDDNSNRIKPLDENIPTLAESYKDGKYEHYNEGVLTDSADYTVKDHALCLSWTWTDSEDLSSENGFEECFYIQQLGNCYLPQPKSPFAWPYREIKTTTFLFVRYGEDANCTPNLI